MPGRKADTAAAARVSATATATRSDRHLVGRLDPSRGPHRVLAVDNSAWGKAIGSSPAYDGDRRRYRPAVACCRAVDVS